VIERDLSDPDPDVQRKAVQQLSYFEGKQATLPQGDSRHASERGPVMTSLVDVLALARKTGVAFKSPLERPLEQRVQSNMLDSPGDPGPTEFSGEMSPRRVKFDGRWMTVELAARERAEHEKWRRQVDFADANESADWTASP
jgi:hypothetical protein